MRAVPEVPTEEMIGDMIDGWFETPPTDKYRHEPRFIERMTRAYKAAIAAAPAPVDGLAERWHASGESHQNVGGIWSAGIDDSSRWGHRIQVHADTIEEAEALRDQVLAALQSRDEPVADTWIIWFDDADRKPELFCGHGATQAANKRYEQISVSWNAHLFAKVHSNNRDATTLRKP